MLNVFIFVDLQLLMLATLPQVCHYQCLMYKLWGCVCVLMLCVVCGGEWWQRRTHCSRVHYIRLPLHWALHCHQPPSPSRRRVIVKSEEQPPFWAAGHRPTALHYCSQSAAFGSRLAEWSAVEHCSSSFHFFCFRMRAKTSEFLKVLNRAKIEEESKKKGSKIGAKSPFI